MGVAVTSNGLYSWTVGGHHHPLGFQGSHIRATHTRGSEVDVVARSEPCVVQQRLDVAEVGIALEAEELQVRESAQWADVGDRVVAEEEILQAR